MPRTKRDLSDLVVRITDMSVAESMAVLVEAFKGDLIGNLVQLSKHFKPEHESLVRTSLFTSMAPVVQEFNMCVNKLVQKASSKEAREVRTYVKEERGENICKRGER
jgi:hypothetical protein